jgi:hypothetical protein
VGAVTSPDDDFWTWVHARQAAAVARPVAAAVPVVLVNVVAFAGQLAFLRAHLPWPPIGQVLVAVTLESVAVYLAWQAHLAQLANDSALRLRLAAYGFAALIAVMNYSHYAGPGWAPTFTAVTVALCSAASPWLWGVHTRRRSRDELMARGLVEPHAVRLGGTRWFWHPYRCVRVMWAASWTGETGPARAIGAVYPVSRRVSGNGHGGYRVPSQRWLMGELGVGQDKARAAQRLLAKATSNGDGQ